MLYACQCKGLIHGCHIIEYFDLSISLLFEKALKARQKEIRKKPIASLAKDK